MRQSRADSLRTSFDCISIVNKLRKLSQSEWKGVIWQGVVVSMTPEHGMQHALSILPRNQS